MLALIGSALQMSEPSPLTRTRKYLAFMRAPAGAATAFYGTVNEYRQGAQHTSRIARFPVAQESFANDFGIVADGTMDIDVVDADSGLAGDGGLSWRNQLVDLELITRIKRENGTEVDLVNEHRGAVQSSARRHNVLTLSVRDVDTGQLEALLPSKTYTTADWPELFVDHVNRPVPQGVGTVLKVPLTYVVKTGAFKYAACEVTGATPDVLTVYRNARVVSSSEYSVATQTVAGTTHLLVTFAREQVDFNGQLYTLEADISFPGSRVAADELSRMLQLLGVTVDPSSFAAAALYHTQQGIYVDAGYVTQRAGRAMVSDLLLVARGQLYRTAAGAYGLFVDKPRDVRLVANERRDEVQIDSYSLPEISKTITLQYRPSTSQREDLTGKLQRTTTGITGETVFKCPYVRDHTVADRLVSYLYKRENNRAEASGSVYGQQLRAGDLVAVDSPTSWSGTKIFSTPGISRPADANALRMREYVEDVYVYASGTLPADATNGYQPDYSQTPPAAPTGLTVVSQGTSADSDGKVTAYALIRATPPSVNWARLMVQITDTTTDEEYQAQLLLTAGNYEARVAGLRPNRTHQVTAWAVNATNVDGVAAAAVSFTSANATTALAAPTVAVSQLQSFQIRIDLGHVSDVAGQPHFRRNVIFVKAGAGAFAEVVRTDQRFYDYPVSHGTAYQVKARSEDENGNESSDSGTSTITPTAIVDSSYIPTGGITGPSIANGSINRGRGYTGTGSSSGSITGGGGGITVTLDYYSFFPSFWCDVAANPTLIQASNAGGAPGNDIGRCKLVNNGATDSYEIQWRNFLA